MRHHQSALYILIHLMLSTNPELNIINILVLQMRKLQPKVTELGKARIWTTGFHASTHYEHCLLWHECPWRRSWSGLVPGLLVLAFPEAIMPTPSAEICSHSQLPLLAMIPLRGASLFLRMLPAGPLQTKCNLWGPGPTRGWPSRRLSPPVVHHHPGTTLTCSVLRASPEDWTPSFHLRILSGYDSSALFWSYDALHISASATNEAEMVLKLLLWSFQSYLFWNVLELFFSDTRENLSVTLSTLLGTMSGSLWFNIPNSLLALTDRVPLCMLFFKVFHKILPNTDPGRMLPRTGASSVYSASCPFPLGRFLTHKISPLVRFPNHNKAYPPPALCVVLPQKHTHISFQSLRCRTLSQMS